VLPRLTTEPWANLFCTSELVTQKAHAAQLSSSQAAAQSISAGYGLLGCLQIAGTDCFMRMQQSSQEVGWCCAYCV
jgi:hypothetical protein